MTDTRTRAQRIRAEKQEALREMLRGKGLIEQVLKNVEKMESAEEKFEVDKNKAAADTRMKLVNKILPDMKIVEGEFELGEETIELMRRTIVDPRQERS